MLTSGKGVSLVFFNFFRERFGVAGRAGGLNPPPLRALKIPTGRFPPTSKLREDFSEVFLGRFNQEHTMPQFRPGRRIHSISIVWISEQIHSMDIRITDFSTLISIRVVRISTEAYGYPYRFYGYPYRIYGYPYRYYGYPYRFYGYPYASVDIHIGYMDIHAGLMDILRYLCMFYGYPLQFYGYP